MIGQATDPTKFGANISRRSMINSWLHYDCVCVQGCHNYACDINSITHDLCVVRSADYILQTQCFLSSTEANTYECKLMFRGCARTHTCYVL